MLVLSPDAQKVHGPREDVEDRFKHGVLDTLKTVLNREDKSVGNGCQGVPWMSFPIPGAFLALSRGCQVIPPDICTPSCQYEKRL